MGHLNFSRTGVASPPTAPPIAGGLRTCAAKSNIGLHQFFKARIVHNGSLEPMSNRSDDAVAGFQTGPEAREFAMFRWRGLVRQI